MNQRTHPPLGPELANLRRAVEFFDRVTASKPDEKIAVGQDHWNWLEGAARNVVKASPTEDYLLKLFDAMGKQIVEMVLKGTPPEMRKLVDQQLMEFREHLEIAS